MEADVFPAPSVFRAEGAVMSCKVCSMRLPPGYFLFEPRCKEWCIRRYQQQ